MAIKMADTCFPWLHSQDLLTTFSPLLLSYLFGLKLLVEEIPLCKFPE